MRYRPGNAAAGRERAEELDARSRPEGRLGKQAMPRSFLTFMLGLLIPAASASLLTACDRGEEVQLLLEAKRLDVPTDEAMERTREIVQRRVSMIVPYGATAARQGQNRILVTFRGREHAEQVKALIARPGRLEFRLVDASATPEQLASGWGPPGSEVLPYAGDDPDARIAVKRRRIVTGAMIADAQSAFESDGRPAVAVRFDDEGTRRFARATRENVTRQFAIVLDNVVVSAPVISEPIVGGSALISGGFTVEESNRLAIALRSGALPIDLVVIDERVIER